MSWAGANVEDCVRMTKFRVLVRKLDNSEIESKAQDFDRSPSTTPNESDYDSDISSDTSSGSSGGVGDFPEEEPGSPNFSNDSSMTIGYTPPHSDIEANICIICANIWYIFICNVVSSTLYIFSF